MRKLGSLIMDMADRHQVPAGARWPSIGWLFGSGHDGAAAHPLISIDRTEVAGLPPEGWSSVIVATAP